jgi:alkylation response protein AidB-like acyl-CoA dehydrogenase
MEGVSVKDAGKRTGLRACKIVNLTLNNVLVKDRFDVEDAEEIIRTAIFLNWVGLSSIALGIAEGAIQAAEKYAGERIQGGKTIEKHSAVKMLLADAHARAEASSSLVYSFHEIGTGNLFLKKAAVTKYLVMESCVAAVTNSMQVFGGYGYIQDYRIEKRLRDVKTLQSMFGSSSYLKNFIIDIEKL